MLGRARLLLAEEQSLCRVAIGRVRPRTDSQQSSEQVFGAIVAQAVSPGTLARYDGGPQHSGEVMQIERTELDTAVGRGIIDDAQATALWSLLLAEQKDRPQFSINHLLYYLGGMVAIGPCS